MIKKLTGRFPLRKLAAAGWLAVMLSVLLPAMGRAQSNPDVLNTTYPDTVAAGSGAFTLEVDGNYTRTPAAFCFYTGYGASATPLATTYGYFPYYYGINVPAATIQQIPPSAFSGGVFNAKVYPVASATASCTGTPNVNYTNSLNVAVTLPTVTFVSATALPRHNTNLSGVAPPTELVVAGTGFGPGATATISGAGFTTFTATTTVTSDSAIRVDTPLVPASATSLNIQICVPSTTYTYCTATKSLNILELAANNGTLTTSGTASNLTLSSTFGAAAGNTAGLPVGSVTFKDGASTLGVAAQTLATQVFAAATTAGTWSTSGGGTLKAFQADFDKDGLPDTLVYDSATGISTLHLLLGSNNRGDTANDFPVSLGYSLSCSNYDGLAVGDFNNDGYPDIALLCDYESTYNGVVYMLMNNGDATFTSNTIFLSQPANAIAAADFNKDGKLDLVLVGKTAAGANNFLTMFGDGTGHFSSTKSSPATSAVATLILAADLNNDGYPDIALANSANGTVTAWQNDKTGGFPTSPNYSRFGYGNNISNLLVTYSTASTYPNLITITPNTETLVYNNRVAALGFSDTGYPITIPGLVTATSGDFNQDGNADLLVSTGSAIQVFYGYSYGQIATTPAYSINAAVSTFAGAGDFNSDGFPDAAAVGYGANSGFARTYVTSGTLTASLPGQSFLTAGYHTLTATNPGTVAWAPGTATNSYFVNPTAAIALTVSPASPATYSPTGTEALTATLTTNSTGYASGTVTFKDGTTTLGTATLAQSGPANTSVATLNFALAAGSHSLTATYNPPPESFPAMTSAAMSYTVNKGTPVVAWTPNPATIAYGTPLTAAQLNATATLGGSTVPGTFVYNPPAGTYLPVGANTVTATFTPTDQANYNTPATASTTINVTPATFAAPTTAVTQTSATQTAYVTIRTAGTPGAINVLAQGAAARDFNLASGSTCSTGTAYTVNQVCAVNYTFSPKAPGLRLGAITLTSGTTLLGTTYISGEGTGPLAVISPGTITAVAGTGAAGYVAAQDNNTTAATSTPLNAPANEAVDGAGNLYISDSANHRIRKVAAATGFISTVAGNGTNAYTASQDTGTTLATSASITVPLGITVDGAGNLYFVDRDSFRVRKVTAATGFISTVAGNGTTGTGAPQDPGNVLATSVGVVPTDVTVDAAGNLYIADQQVHRVRKVTAATGFISTIAGNGTAGYNATQDTGTTAATATSLNGPAAVALDKSGNVYIADSNNNRVRKVSASTGFISTVAGNGTTTYNAAQDTGATAATGSSISNPQGVAVDAAGNLFVSDYGHARQRKVEAATGFISTVAVSGTAGPIGSGEGIALDGAGNLFVADVNANIVRRVAATVPAILTFPTTTAFASSTPQNATLSNNGDTTPLTLTALAIDSTSFSLAGSTCTATGTVAAGNKCVLSVTFTPQMAGALTGTAKATDNSLNVAGSMQAVPLAGTGALATKTITFNQPTTPAPLNSSDTLSATASNGDAVVFSVLAGSADISGNTITYTSPGTVTIAADSPANGAYAAATRVTRDVQVTQNSTYTSVYSYDNPATVGDSVTLVATVNASNEGTPTGSVSFYDGTNLIQTTDLYFGQAYIDTSSLSVGTHQITAVYNGDGTYQGSTSEVLEQVINKRQAVVTWAQPANIVAGTPLTSKQLNAIATEGSRGDEGEAFGPLGGGGNSPLSGGNKIPGTFVYDPPAGTVLGVGTHTLTVTFTPADTATYDGGTASVDITVTAPVADPGTLTATPNPATPQSSVVLSATFGNATSTAGLPTGSVTFKDGATTLGTAALQPVAENFVAATAQTIDPSDFSSNTATVTDFNRDGIPDALVVESGSYLYLVPGADHYGNLMAPTSLSLPFYCDQTLLVTTADFNNDGYPDIAVVCPYNPYGDSAYVFLNYGDGTFDANNPTRIDLPTISSSIAAADVNKDGNVDLVLSGQIGSGSTIGLTVLVGSGDGNFTVGKQTVSTAAAGTQLSAVDLNNDGYADVVVGNSGSVAVFKNDGTSAFGAAPVYSKTFPGDDHVLHRGAQGERVSQPDCDLDGNDAADCRGAEQQDGGAELQRDADQHVGPEPADGGGR